MNLYAHDLSILDFNYGLSDSFGEPLSHRFLSSGSLFHGDDDDYRRNIPYRCGGVYGGESASDRIVSLEHRHDGKSPLPLGMDWSAPPRKWEGRSTVWPHDPRTGWSYCVTVPSWNHITRSSVSDPAVFYRVQVAIQSPEGITAARLILRRFSDFLELYSSIKKGFPKKRLPQAPPKKILRMKSQTLLEERRYFLEDWMNTLLSDIDISRSAAAATFLELEAAVRSYFSDGYQENEDTNPYFSGDVLSFLPNSSSDASLIPGSSSVASDHVNDTADEASDLGTPNRGKDSHKDHISNNSLSGDNVTDWHELIKKYGLLDKNPFQGNIERLSSFKMDRVSETGIANGEDSSSVVKCQRLDGNVMGIPTEATESNSTLARDGGPSNPGVSDSVSSLDLHDRADEDLHEHDAVEHADFKSRKDLAIAFHSEERQRLNRVIDTLKQRLESAKSDMEDLIARLNQEDAVRQFMSMKIKDLEVELETTRESCKQGMEHAVLSEKERFTQMQWDMEELRKQYMEMELLFNTVQDEKAQLETMKQSLVQENEMLLQQMNAGRDNLDNLRKEHEELEVKSKADLKILVKEVKSLRTSQSELKQELSRLMKEKLEMERIVDREKNRAENAKTANEKLLHECYVLRDRLQESSVSFLIDENSKLIVDASYQSDAINQLATSDNRIGLLLAEAQLLAEENGETDMVGGRRDSNDVMRKMLTEVLIDNAGLRKQITSLLRCVLSENELSDKGEEEEENVPLARTVLSKILEK
ncbi:PREDICTED: uncharacterized protein LOC104818021 [Tarenaya hassleriana]|uniref:uncharacterized protein LOC104818021 n=1 Tax=Tarenaya hassleriana TaxID=28532 RepID=UPI00053C4C3E|nr:PREDICTED: uncharacterized protein LOC104818021 [Tarenaya hassleriana]